MGYEKCKLKSMELEHKPQDSVAGEGWGELLGFFCMNGCPSILSAWYTCDLASIHGNQSGYFWYGMLEVAFL